MKTHEAAVEGDAGQVVAGNSVHKEANAQSHLSNVITINNNEALTPVRTIIGMRSNQFGAASEHDHCAGCAAIAVALERMRTGMGLLALGLVCVMAVTGYAIFSGPLAPAATGAPPVCQHDGKAYSLGSVVRMSDYGIYECSVSADGGWAVRWAPVMNPAASGRLQ